MISAEHLLGDAVETRRRMLGAEHPNRLASVNRLASLPGQCCEAEPLLCEAVAGSKSVLGVELPGKTGRDRDLASQGIGDMKKDVAPHRCIEYTPAAAIVWLDDSVSLLLDCKTCQ